MLLIGVRVAKVGGGNRRGAGAVYFAILCSYMFIATC